MVTATPRDPLPHPPCGPQPWALTAEVLAANARVPPLLAGADPAIPAGVGVAEVDLRFAVVPSEALWAAAPQASDGVDGPKEGGGGGDEGGRAVELEDGDALHVVLAGLPQADVVIEGQHLQHGGTRQCHALHVQLLLQLLRAEVAPAPRRQGREADVEHRAAHVRVVLDVEDEDVLLGRCKHGGHPFQEGGQQRGEEALLPHVLQPHRDAVGQHVLRDDDHAQDTLGRHAVDPVCAREQGHAAGLCLLLGGSPPPPTQGRALHLNAAPKRAESLAKEAWSHGPRGSVGASCTGGGEVGVAAPSPSGQALH